MILAGVIIVIVIIIIPTLLFYVSRILFFLYIVGMILILCIFLTIHHILQLFAVRYFIFLTQCLNAPRHIE